MLDRFSQILKTARRFGRAEQGNVVFTFAVALVPILAFMGVAIDYSRVNSARSSMQAAMDSAALMVGRDVAQGLVATDQVNAKAQSYFAGLFHNTDTSGAAVTATYTASSSLGSTIKITGSGTVSTDFMRVVGFPSLSFNTTSTSAWGNVRMRVAMALDNTGSMAQDGKIGALQTAAKNLIDQLSAIAKNPGDIYVSIVPFAKDINIGSSNYSQNWIDWTDWESEAAGIDKSNFSQLGPGSPCPWSMYSDGITCLSGPGSTNAVSSIPSNGNVCPGPDSNSRYGYAYHYLINGCYNTTASANQTTVCTGNSCSCNNYSNSCSCSGSGNSKTCKQPTFSHTWVPNNHNTWSGCLADRTQSYDTQNTTPSTSVANSLFPAENYYENNESYCATGNSPLLQPVMPLSYNWSTLKSAIDTMQPTGGTNQPIGLAHAWQTLAQNAPYNAPAEDSNYTYKKAIILLSDGLNTENRWPSYGNGSTQNGTMIDDRQKIMCDNIKAQGITIYTLQVNTSSPADPTSSVLQYCASGSENFYLITSANQTVAAFNSIGTSLSKLRVAR